MQLAEPAALHGRGLAGMEEVVLRPLDLRLDAQRREQRFDRALRAAEAALGDPGQMPALVRQLLAGREVHARELEERDPLVARVEVALHRADEAGDERRPQHRLVRGERIGKAERVGVRVAPVEAPRVRLVEPGADERVLGTAAQALLAGQATRAGATGKGEGDLVQVNARDLLDDVGLARDVAGAPGRHDNIPGVRLDEPEPREQPPLVVLGNLEAVQRVRALRAEMDHRPVGQPGRRRRWNPRACAPASSRSSAVAWSAAGSARYGSTPFSQRFEPSVRSPSRSESREDPGRLEVRGLEEDVRRLGPHLGLLAAHDRGERDRLFRVRDHEDGAVELAVGAVERAHLLAGARRADDDLPPGKPVEVERVQRAPERVHDVVGHVDDVRDRAHARGRGRRALSQGGESPTMTSRKSRPM